MNYHKSDQSQTLAIMVNKPLMQHPCARWFDVTNSVVFQLNLKKSFLIVLLFHLVLLLSDSPFLLLRLGTTLCDSATIGHFLSSITCVHFTCGTKLIDTFVVSWINVPLVKEDQEYHIVSQTSNSVHSGHAYHKCKDVIDEGVESFVCKHSPWEVCYRFQFIVDE